MTRRRTTVLAIPDPTPALDVEALAASVPAVLAAIELIDDIGQAEELRARAAALEEYLTRRSLDAAPAWAIARNLEARVGALLGDNVRGRHLSSDRDRMIAEDDRPLFRLLNRYRKVWETAPGPRRQVLQAIERYRRKVIDADARAVDDLHAEDAEGAGWTMLAGELADRAKDVGAGTVDLIVTDPPYPTEALERWSELAEHAAKLLKPQGILVALSGKITLPDVIDRLREHLAYGWVYCQPLPGSSSRILARHVGQTWKPWLAFSNGPWPSGRVDWHPDTLDGAPMAKTLYHWQQSTGPAAQLIHFLAPENGLVLDPFAGVGTYGLAAIQTGRRFLGIEADSGRFAKAAERLEDQS
jgi:16S rRNA G966 N2-methylase RsmD